jgi:hypothetical protein
VKGPDAVQLASVDLEMARYVFGLGVDGLFTDNPDLFPRTPSRSTTESRERGGEQLRSGSQ